MLAQAMKNMSFVVSKVNTNALFLYTEKQGREQDTAGLASTGTERLDLQ